MRRYMSALAVKARLGKLLQTFLIITLIILLSVRNRVIRAVTEFICTGTGGPQEYTGKDMLAAHRGMNINEHEYLAVINDIMAALEKNGIGEREKQEVLSIAYSLKSEILHV